MKTPAGPDHPGFKGEWFTTRDGTTRAFVWIDDAMRVRLGVKRPVAPRARVVWATAHPDEPLRSWEPIHHLNQNALDDCPENLVKLPSQKVHAEIHAALNAPAVEARRMASTHRCPGCNEPIPSWRQFCSTACRAQVRRGTNHPNTGRNWSPDVRERMAASKRGKVVSPETREKMAAAHRARWAEARATTTGQAQLRGLRAGVPSERRARGIRNANAKLTEESVREIRRLALDGATQTVLAQQFGVSQPLIGMIIRRKAWTHIE